MPRILMSILILCLFPAAVSPADKEIQPPEKCDIWGYVLDHYGKVRSESFNILLRTYPNPGFKECKNDPGCYNLHARTFPHEYYCFNDVPKPNSYELIINYRYDIDHGNPPRKDMDDDIFPPDNKVVVHLSDQNAPLRHDFHAVRVASVKGRLLWENGEPIGDVGFNPVDPAFFNPFANPYDPITENDGSFQVSGLAPRCDLRIKFRMDIDMMNPDDPYSAAFEAKAISGALFGLLNNPLDVLNELKRKYVKNEVVRIKKTFSLPCMKEGSTIDIGEISLPNLSRDEPVLTGRCFLEGDTSQQVDANVTLSNDQISYKVIHVRDDGSYRFYSAPEGRYKLTCSFSRKECSNCELVGFIAESEVHIKQGELLTRDLVLKRKD